MRYTDETLSKYTVRALEAIEKASSRLDQLKVHIAKGNKKVGRIRNVSLMSRICCGNCRTCEHYCYDIKAALQYKTVMTARAENTALAQGNRIEYFGQIASSMTPKCKRKAFRFHVGGEILDEAYLRGMIWLAFRRPDWRIWTYTKRYDIVNRYIQNYGIIPENLSIMYSADSNAVVENPYCFPIAWTVLEGEEEPRDKMKCPGNCEECYENGCGCPFGESVYFLEH